MTSKIGVKKIIYPNGSDAITISTTGALTVHSTDSSTFAGKIMANSGISAYGTSATGVNAPIRVTDENSNQVTFGLTNAGHLAVRNYNSNADIYFSDDSNQVNLRLYNDGTLKGMSEGGSGLDVNFTQGSAKVWSHTNYSDNSLRDAYNVSSLTDIGTGRFQHSFTNNMNNSSYSGHMSLRNNLNQWWVGAYNTTHCQTNSYTGSAYSDQHHKLAVFGDLA